MTPVAASIYIAHTTHRRAGWMVIALLVALLAVSYTGQTVTAQSGPRPMVTSLAVKGLRSLPRPTDIVYNRGEPIVIPFQVTGQALALYPQNVVVGALSGPGPTGFVSIVNCRTSSPLTVTLVCLDIADLAMPGVYSGSVDVTDNGDAKDAVPMTVTVTDAPIWPVLAALAGVLIAALVLVLTQGLEPYLTISKRARDLQKNIKSANEEASPARRGYTLRDELYFKTFWAKLKTYRVRLIWDVASDNYKALVKMLDDAQADLDRFRDDLGPRLDELEHQLAGLKTYLDDDPLAMDATAVPRVAFVVAAHLTGTPVPIATLKGRFDAWDQTTSLLGQWRQMADKIVRLRTWVAQLQPAVDAGGEEQEQRQLLFAEDVLTRSVHDLYELGNVEGIDSLRVDPDLRMTRRLVGLLGAKYHVWPLPEPGLTPKAVKPLGAFASFLKQLLAGLTPPRLEEISPQALVRARFALDAGLLLFALAAAVFVGLQQLYIGKVFGTTADYLGMLLLGGGAQAAVVGIVVIADRMIRR